MNTIEYFYAAHSAFAYIGHARLLEICARHQCRLVHRPMELSPVVEASGAVPFANRSRAHDDYYFGREIERWAAYRGVEILNQRPTHHDNDYALANGVLIAAAAAGADVDRLSYAVLRAHWRDDVDLGDQHQVREVVAAVSPECTEYLDVASSAEVQAVHRANTAEAIERDVFGSPTYFLNGDMYYGQDHLELIEHGLVTPFAPNTFRSAAVDATP